MRRSAVPVSHAELDDLYSRFTANRTDLALANEYWEALGNLEGSCGWAAEEVVNVFRELALARREGLVSLAWAQYGLFTTSGQSPEPRLIDDDLVKRMEDEIGSLEGNDYLVVWWVLTNMRYGVQPPRAIGRGG